MVHSHRKNFITVVDDQGRLFCYLRRPAPRLPSADAERLRSWRRDNGLSQAAAAKLLKSSPWIISRSERTPDALPEALLAKLAKAEARSDRRRRRARPRAGAAG